MGKRARAPQCNYMLFMLLKVNGCQYGAWKGTIACLTQAGPLMLAMLYPHRTSSIPTVVSRAVRLEALAHGYSSWMYNARFPNKNSVCELEIEGEQIAASHQKITFSPARFIVLFRKVGASINK